jgi:hypothetical protein
MAEAGSKPRFPRLRRGIRRVAYFIALSLQEPIYGVASLISIAAIMGAIAALVLQSGIAPDGALILPLWLRDAQEAAPRAFLFGAIGIAIVAQAFSRAFDLLVGWLDPR